MTTTINAKLKKSDRLTNVEKYRVAVQIHKVLQNMILGQKSYLLRHQKVEGKKE